MSFQPRPYQQEAIDSNLAFFQDTKQYHGLEILPTGSGKSVVIANTAKGLEGKTIVFQPSKEILAQNFAKYISYGYRASIYSASANMKHVDKVTFATIGSVAKKHHLFREFNNIIIDECHQVNAEGGMYRDFIESLEGAKVLGLTATPYRLSTGSDGAQLKFLTRTRPRIFSKVLYMVQTDVLFESGHLAPLEYYSFDVIDRSMLETNKGGTDFTEASMKRYYQAIDMPKRTIHFGNRILAKRDSLLIFCGLLDEAYKVAQGISGSVVINGNTAQAERDRILKQFIAGKIRCVINVGVLTTGFDFPGLQAVLIARSTMSLALYYQIVGRVMRPYKLPDGTMKRGWVVDLGGNINFFGKIETMKIETDKSGLHYVSNLTSLGRRQLTNVAFSKN